MTGPGIDFDYSNLSGRPPGRVVSMLGRVLPGVARVEATVPGFAADWRGANVEALGSTGPLWVVLGDSLCQGIGAPAYDRGWVGQLRDRLAAQGRPHRVVNLSVSGARTADVIDRQLPALERLPAADLVTLMIGSNDMIRRVHRDGLVERYDTILRALPVGAVVTTMPNPNRISGLVNERIAAVARERGLVVAELRDPRTRSWRGKLAADHFHPNEHGYAAIADVVADFV